MLVEYLFSFSKIQLDFHTESDPHFCFRSSLPRSESPDFSFERDHDDGRKDETASRSPSSQSQFCQPWVQYSTRRPAQADRARFRSYAQNSFASKLKGKFNFGCRHSHSGFVCAFHPAAPGLSPKHTIYAFIIYSIFAIFFVWEERK